VGLRADDLVGEVADDTDAGMVRGVSGHREPALVMAQHQLQEVHVELLTGQAAQPFDLGRVAMPGIGPPPRRDDRRARADLVPLEKASSQRDASRSAPLVERGPQRVESMSG
jgi:hypothetical protein